MIIVDKPRSLSCGTSVETVGTQPEYTRISNVTTFRRMNEEVEFGS